MLIYWLWLTTRKGLRRQAIRKLLAYFDTPEDAYRAPETEYRLAGLEEKDLRPLQEKSLVEPRRILELCARKNIHILTCQDAGYPVRLANIPDPPVVLYYTGVLPDVDGEPAIAVIGSRKSSAYGLTCAKRLGYQIVACGGMVVSGMAAGGDAMAMTGAISAGGKVVGVLGCGVDVIYPRQNKSLYEDMRRYGCLISEYPPETPPLRQNFPARNRIISGLSLGVVVVEAPAKSGTLITANYALEQGRDVFAIPGNIGFPSCAGSNGLLKDGATMIETGWDVMQEYTGLFPDKIRKRSRGEHMLATCAELRQLAGIQDPPQKDYLVSPRSDDKISVDISQGKDYIDLQEILGRVSEDEGTVLKLLQNGPRHVDELMSESGLSAGIVLANLTMLEIKKYVRRLPGNRYELAEIHE